MIVRYGLMVGAVLLAKSASAAPPPQAPLAKEFVQQGNEELVLARDAERHKQYSQRVAHLKQAINDFQAALRVMPDDYYAYQELGLAEFMNGRLYHAIEYYNAAIALYPEAARSYMCRGNAYYQLGQFDIAGKDWQMAFRFDPSVGPNLSANLAEQQRIYREVHAPPAV